jgi:hypothetical protein
MPVATTQRLLAFLCLLRGENEIGASLRIPDRLTLDEAWATAALTLKVVYGLLRYRRVAMDGKETLPVFVLLLLMNV